MVVSEVLLVTVKSMDSLIWKYAHIRDEYPVMDQQGGPDLSIRYDVDAERN
jgi:hypothetical protein